MTLALQNNIYRFLLTTRAQIVGEVASPIINITTSGNDAYFEKKLPVFVDMLDETPGYRCNLFVSIDVANLGDKNVNLNLDYSYLGSQVALWLTILFGDLVVSHGPMQKGNKLKIAADNIFPLPLRYHVPRRATEFPWNLEATSCFFDLLMGQNIGFHNYDKLYSAASFYYLALFHYELSPDLSWSLLVCALETLSLLFEYKDEDLISDNVKTALERIAKASKQGAADAALLRGQMFQLKRKCVLTVRKLITPKYYEVKPRKGLLRGEPDGIKEEKLDASVKAAYDLRSLHLHTGMQHSIWTQFWESGISEEALSHIEDRDLRKKIKNAPSLEQLEAMVHCCIFNALWTQRK